MERWVDQGHALLDAAAREERDTGISGSLGDALFACAFGHLPPLAVHEWIQRAVAALESGGGPASLHDGFAGLGLVVALYRDDAEELLADLDDLLCEQLGSVPPASMQSGVAGIALYASLRSGAPSGRRLTRAVVETLAAASLETMGGRVWPTPAAYARARGVNVLGEPVVEYGMVHGVGGALVGLAALAAHGDEAARGLLRDGLVAAWAHARDGDNRFGRILFGPGGALGEMDLEEPRWCVGDAGVLRALWIAARVLGDAPRAERALAAMRADAARHAAHDHLGGAINLCCGAGAVAQVYLRMHRETGEEGFLAANRALLARCATRFDGHPDLGFRYGKMGVLLALLAAERDDDPAWDAMLGMSVPRRAT